MGREPPLAPTQGAERFAVLSDFFAGALAGVACDAILHPLDTIKSRLHVQKGPPFKYRSLFHAFSMITRQEGPRGLYAGFSPVLIGSASSHAFMFAAYKAAKRRGEQLVPEDDQISSKSSLSSFSSAHEQTNSFVSPETRLTVVDLTSGAIGELFALPFYVPMEVIAKRMQVAGLGPARNYHSVTHAAQSIYRTEGKLGLLTGFWPTMLRDVPFTAIQFSLFTFGKDQYRHFSGRHEINDIEATGLGAIVGAISAILTNPFDVIKTRFMTQGTGSERKYHSILQCFRRMLVEDGVMSFARGCGVRVLWIALGSGIQLSVYERASKFLKMTWDVEQRDEIR